MTALEREQKILVLAGVLPVIANIIEDLNDDLFKQSLKRTANLLHQEIRKNDEMILRKTGIEIWEEQAFISRSFNMWIKKNFDVEEAQKIMIETFEKEEQLKKEKELELEKSQFSLDEKEGKMKCKCGSVAVFWKTGYICGSITAYPCEYSRKKQ
jgi:hypothetical protein